VLQLNGIAPKSRLFNRTQLTLVLPTLIDFFISRSNRKKEMSISSAYQSPGCTRAEDQVNQRMTLYFSLPQSNQKV
jgi:hypothetical protein